MNFLDSMKQGSGFSKTVAEVSGSLDKAIIESRYMVFVFNTNLNLIIIFLGKVYHVHGTAFIPLHTGTIFFFLVLSLCFVAIAKIDIHI